MKKGGMIFLILVLFLATGTSLANVPRETLRVEKPEPVFTEENKPAQKKGAKPPEKKNKYEEDDDEICTNGQAPTTPAFYFCAFLLTSYRAIS